MESNKFWKIGDVIYKFAVVSLLVFAALLLKDIRDRQQRMPTLGDFKDAKSAVSKSIIADQMPIVRVSGGNITVDGSVQIER